MASYYKLPDGRWRGQLFLGTNGHGKPRYKVKEAPTKREVKEKLDKLEKIFAAGVDIEKGSTTLADFLANWLDQSVKRKVRDSTFESYEYVINNHIVPALGSTPLNKVSPQAVQRFINDKHDGGTLSTRTVRYLHAVLRSSLNTAMRWQLIDRNPANLVELPRLVTKKLEPYSPEELAEFLRAIQGDRLRSLFITAVGTGLREGELLALRWPDVSLDMGLVTVKHSLRRVKGGGLKLGEPKSASSRRPQPIEGLVVEALRDQKQLQDLERAAAKCAWKETGHVFTTTIGTPLDPCNVGNRFRKILKDHGLRPINFHMLRHTYASLQLLEGANLKEVSELLGHSQIGVTANFYTHIYQQAKREAAKRIDGVLRRATLIDAPTVIVQ